MTPAPGDESREVPMSLEEESLAERTAAAIALLETIAGDRTLLAHLPREQKKRLLVAAGRVARPGPWEKRQLADAARRLRNESRRTRDEQALSRSGIRVKRTEPVFATPLVGPAPVPAGADLDARVPEPAGAPEAPVVQDARNCYVCKRDYHALHHFYDSLCPSCGDRNWAKRHQTADLAGRVALITGGRVKIGYQAAIKLLRAGARAIVTTRFPRDAATRFAREPDFGAWSGRLQIHGLDLRHTPSVEALALYLLGTLDRLDFILNNACQTVRRPAGFYRHLLTAEREPRGRLPGEVHRTLAAHEELRADRRRLAGPTDGRLPDPIVAPSTHADSAELSQLALLDEDLVRDPRIFPAGQLDADRQQVDLRRVNSWRLRLHEVPAVELLEVHLVNAVAPFVLNARLKPLMIRVPTRDKHVVNVSAMEGQFYRTQKTDRHPHTNMAKAALNMLTRTSAADYIKDGIHMNSVDTGWITDEDPAELAARKIVEQRFHPPLDIVDGAARICDPIFHGFLTGEHVWGRFLKDYAPTDW